MNLKNTQTEKNLKEALKGESVARNQYNFFAQIAREEGNEAVAAAFEQMANNEMMHAKFWFELVRGMPKSTNACLIKAAQGEYDEWHSMYPEFAKTAREEGFDEIAEQFEKVAKIERTHENRFLMLMAELSKQNKSAAAVPAQELPKQKKYGYRCQFCGEILEQHADVCDVCGAIGAFEYVEYYE